MIEKFDPLRHGFVKLADFHYPGKVSCYEYQNHPLVNGEPDFTRLNVFLSKDGNYVRVWFGFIETIFAETRLESVEMPPGFDLSANYEEHLFAGWIDFTEQAGHVLRAIRPERHLPQKLQADDKNRIACMALETVESR